ncbi:signal recognition particle-docking protein FtsY [Demequina zhanjiangensis]|uniref:Signal recognition particle receptor FtsY n=1 Tax=Demequina zhanjiangensis TaxID=3051659 RepID=A0ABT8G4B0_9MICO|nr:signal recognition particle-docking protein FtsY [Demequina sp. SYSU T00b26]MDN4473539.1 signal recognition particle-docking protein FtsY [Demequina sp. SYSU T00b26]
MDVSWIPGSADLVVVIVAVAAVAGGAFAALRRGKGPDERAGGPSAPTERPAAPEAPAKAKPAGPEDPGSRLARLRSRLSGGLGSSLLSIFSRGSLSAEDWEELEETLLAADVGAASTDILLEDLKARLKASPDAEPISLLREALLDVVDPTLDRSLALEPQDGVPATAVVVGVNGVGKTTTVGKLARVLVAEGSSVVLGAADTFRAAAADQLETWGSRVGVPVVRSDREGADPASVAFEAAQKGKDDGADVVLVDTAGRLQNKAGLMDELGKIVRVVSKVSPPSEVLLVLDATTGQNGLTQARVFGEVAPLTGIVLTKLDGTARGGIVVAVQRELGVPVKFIGLGEGEDDLAPFDAEQFVDGLLGR